MAYLGLYSHTTLFRAEIGLLILSSGSDRGCRVWAEKKKTPLSNSVTCCHVDEK